MEDERSTEKEAVHKDTENILTASAVAELASELTAVVDGCGRANDDHDSKEENIGILTIPANALNATPVEVSDEENSSPAGRFGHVQPLDTSISIEHEIIPGSSELQTNLVDSKFPKVKPAPVPHTNLAMPQAEPRLDQETRDDDDWESLISYSETGDTTSTNNVLEPTLDMHVSSKEIIQNDRVAVIQDKVNTIEGRSQSVGNINPNDTLGVNEIVQFASSEIKPFQDTEIEGNLEPHAETEGLCLNGTFTFSVHIEQARITSPPKRQISSLNQHDNVITTLTSA
jgi:hypothetical protein